MRKLWISGLFVALLAGFAACSSGVSKSARWSAYPGCNPAQCKTWYEECSAECINNQTTTVTECENKCRANINSCEEACPG